MGLSGGIIGLPNAGKSTLFNALTNAGVQVADFPFCTVSPNVGMIPVPDPRLDKLAALIHPQRVTPATIEIVDVAGLIKGAHKGEGLGNEFLSRIRGVDVLIEVVRCFEEGIPHPEGSIDPVRDMEIIKLELFLSDLQIIDRRLTRLNKLLKSGVKKDERYTRVLFKIKEALEKGISPVNSLSSEEYQLVKDDGFLSLKPVIYVANTQEDVNSSTLVEKFREFVQKEGLQGIEMCAQLEMELSELPVEEQQKFLEEMEIKERAINRLINEVFKKLNLITFFTLTGGKEVRAWAIEKGTSAVDAAGKVHSDMKRGFIRAEVISAEELIEIGSLKRARSEGKVKLEGKDYKVKDGDVIHFYFAV